MLLTNRNETGSSFLTKSKPMDERLEYKYGIMFTSHTKLEIVHVSWFRNHLKTQLYKGIVWFFRQWAWCSVWLQMHTDQ